MCRMKDGKMLKVILESFNVKVNTSTTWVTKTKHDVQKWPNIFLKSCSKLLEF